jgi:hypothetical protein
MGENEESVASAENEQRPARFCPQCGLSLVPLDVPHVARPCSACGKTVHLVERAEDGKGIKIRAGDEFTIPAGWITMSLDPSKATGRFFRGGVGWFVQRLLIGDIPRDPGDLDELLTRYEREADEILRASPKLSHLDPDNEEHGAEAFEILEKDQTSIEWWAMVLGGMEGHVRDCLKAGESEAAVLSACRMQAAHSMLVFKRHLEEHVWTGYRHSQLIYDVAAAGATTPQEAEIIRALSPAFERLDEDVLHAWVEADVEFGERLGVTQIKEPLLKALAAYHLSLFERRRREDQLRSEQDARTWANRIAGAGAGAAIVGSRVGLHVGVGGREGHTLSRSSKTRPGM